MCACVCVRVCVCVHVLILPLIEGSHTVTSYESGSILIEVQRVQENAKQRIDLRYSCMTQCKPDLVYVNPTVCEIQHHSHRATSYEP